MPLWTWGQRETAAYWDRAAPIYGRLFERGPLGRSRRRAVELLDPQPGERLLIVGCGPAPEARWLPEDARTVGVDLSRAMLHRARHRLDQTAQMDAQRLALPDDAFDAVLLSLICTVAPDGAAVLAEAVRVCRPGGRIVLHDKLRRGPNHLGWRLLRAIGRHWGTDLGRRLDDILPGRGRARVVHDEGVLLGGYVRVIRLDVP